MPTGAQNVPKALVLYIIWFALTGSIFVYQFILGGGFLQGANALPQGFGFPIPLIGAEIAAAAVVRWAVIPRLKGPSRMLIALVIGMALSESAELFGIFLVPRGMPQTKMVVFYLAVVSAFQFLPTFARSDDPPSLDLG